MSTAAVRNRTGGKAHLDSGTRYLRSQGPDVPVSVCGRGIRDAELLAWGATAEEDRCTRCTARTATR